MDSNSQPLGICQRLFNFIMSAVIRPLRTTRDYEIKVELSHTEEGFKNKADEHHDFSPNSGQKTNIVAKGKEIQEVEAVTGKRPKKSVTIREGQTVKKREHNPSDDQATKAKTPPDEDTKPKPTRSFGPLINVASNINEKSAAFISSRKKAMRRNYSLDPDQKS